MISLNPLTPVGIVMSFLVTFFLRRSHQSWTTGKFLSRTYLKRQARRTRGLAGICSMFFFCHFRKFNAASLDSCRMEFDFSLATLATSMRRYFHESQHCSHIKSYCWCSQFQRYRLNQPPSRNHSCARSCGCLKHRPPMCYPVLAIS